MTHRVGKRLRESLVWTAVLATTILLVDQIDLGPSEQVSRGRVSGGQASRGQASRGQVLRGQESLCRSIALTATTLLADDDLQQLDSILRSMTLSDPYVHAIQVLAPDGRVIARTDPAEQVVGGPQASDRKATRLALTHSGQRLGELNIELVAADDSREHADAFISPLAIALLLLITPLAFLGFFSSSSVGDVSGSIDTPPRTCDNRNTDAKDSQPRTASQPAPAIVPNVDQQAQVDVKSCDDTVIELNSTPIYSSLPIDDEEIREVIDKFIERLGPRLKGMRQSLQSADFETLQTEAHWLKGSGGTVGYEQLTDPAKQLEQAAKERDVSEALAILEQLESLQTRMAAGRVRNRDQHADQQPVERPKSPIHCRLPLHDPEYRDIVMEFIDRLDVRLMGMLSLLQTQSFRELENEAHWLKGAAGTVGFPEIAAPAERLVLAACREDVESCQAALRDILDVRQRLAIPDEDPALLESQV